MVMKIGTTSFAHKKLFLSALAFTLLGMATVATLEITKVTDFIKQNPSEQSGPSATEKAEQDRAVQQDKKDFIESPDPIAQTSTADNNTTIELSAKQESNGSVTVLTKLRNISEGTCTLTVSNKSMTDVQTARIIYQPDFSSCAGFSVRKDKIGAGEWVIKLAVASDTTIEKTMSLKVN